MRQQLPTPCQAHGVDAVRLEYMDGQVGTNGNNHQRHEEMVSASQFGYEEYASQRCMHDTRHQSAHPQQGIVVFGQGDAKYFIHIPHLREHKTEDTTQE